MDFFLFFFFFETVGLRSQRQMNTTKEFGKNLASANCINFLFQAHELFLFFETEGQTGQRQMNKPMNLYTSCWEPQVLNMSVTIEYLLILY